MSSEYAALRELFNARFDALEARFGELAATQEKENIRQDEAIERLADRTTHINETKRLKERVERVENLIDVGRNNLSDLSFKMKITWAIGSGVIAGMVAIAIAYIKYMLGI